MPLSSSTRIRRLVGKRARSPESRISYVDRIRYQKKSNPVGRFKHAQLDGRPNSIRVVEIVPRRKDDPPSFSIRHTTTSSTYIALSYEWGSQTQLYAITVDGLRFDIGYNLYEFLKVAFRHTGGIPVWIDALCVDQTNTNELNHQVQQMGEIYYKAEVVLSWLGPRAPSEWPLFDILEHQENSDDIKLLGATIIDSLRGTNPDEVIADLQQVVHNEYWNRMWIIQELMLAQHVVLLHGDKQSSCSSLLTLIDYVLVPAFNRSRDQRDPVWSQHFEFIISLRESRANMLLAQRVNYMSRQREIIRRSRLSTLLACHFDGESLRWQDRVFAVLSMAANCERFMVDYNHEPGDMITTVSTSDFHSSISEQVNAVQDLLRIFQLRGMTAEDIVGSRCGTIRHTFNSSDDDNNDNGNINDNDAAESDPIDNVQVMNPPNSRFMTCHHCRCQLNIHNIPGPHYICLPPFELDPSTTSPAHIGYSSDLQHVRQLFTPEDTRLRRSRRWAHASTAGDFLDSSPDSSPKKLEDN